MEELYGGVEAGGTKFICGIGSSPNNLITETEIPTTSTAETLNRVVRFFRQEMYHHHLESIGIASFGPLDLDQSSSTYGYITATPKPGWSDTDLLGTIERELNVKGVIDTDVNGAALAEYMWGAAQGLDDFIYLTVGTGIGGGGIVNKRPLHGLIHPEMGHIRIPHDKVLDPFPGVCPFHGDCFEGLASGTAMEQRWNSKPGNLPENHPAWILEAHYLAAGISNLICTLSPELVIIGGGIMEHVQLIEYIRQETLELLGGYIKSVKIIENIDSYIVKPALGRRVGLFGGIALAAGYAGA